MTTRTQDAGIAASGGTEANVAQTSLVSVVNITGFNEFDKFTQCIDDKGPPVLFYFSGTKTADGQSWCPDCVSDNYEEFVVFADKHIETKKHVYFMFTGKKKENGRSWCIYCQMAEPIVKAYLGELQKSIIFAYVDVGDRAYWKDKACPFRTDSRTKLMVIPTIIRWKGVQRLEGSQCNNRELLQMLFEDEE